MDRGPPLHLLPSPSHTRPSPSLFLPSPHVLPSRRGGAIAWAVAHLFPTSLDRLAILNAPHGERFKTGLFTLTQMRKSWWVASHFLTAHVLFIGLCWISYLPLTRRAFLQGLFTREGWMGADRLRRHLSPRSLPFPPGTSSCFSCRGSASSSSPAAASPCSASSSARPRGRPSPRYIERV